MEQLKIFQRQFETAERQFSKIAHLIVYRKDAGGDCGGSTVTEVMLQQKKRTSAILRKRQRLSLARRMRVLGDEAGDCQVKIEPKYNPTPEKTLAYWRSDADPSYDGDFYEQHWLLAAEGRLDGPRALETIESLARNIVFYIIDDERWPGVANIYTEAGPRTSNESYIRCWLMMVRYLQPSTHIKKVDEGKGFTLAEPGEKGYSVIENVFLASVLACSDMIGAIMPNVANDGRVDERNQRMSEEEKIAAIAAYLLVHPHSISEDVGKSTGINASEVRRLWGPIKDGMKVGKYGGVKGYKRKGIIISKDESASCQTCQAPISSSFECSICNAVIVSECKTCHFTNTHPKEAIP